MKPVIFTLTSARSGTVFLRELFRRHLPDWDTRHETFFDRGNPTMLGPAVYDAYAGRLDRLRALLARKRAYIQRLPGRGYLESSHAFLKSAYRVALEIFPDLRLIHLVRDPLLTSKSEARREAWRRRLRAPLHYYRGDDGQRHFYWALTRNEEIFRRAARPGFSLFQLYLLQWIEIENRALAFLEQPSLHERCFTLRVPGELNDPARLRTMFEFFGTSPRLPLRLAGRKNRSFGARTVITPEDERATAEVFQSVPGEYLEIFRREPYRSQPWSARLRPPARLAVTAGP